MNRPSLRRHKNLLTGLFLASAVIAFLVSTAILFRQKGVFNPRYALCAVFDNGVGMRQGADVLFNGVKVGRVESVSLLGAEVGSGSAGKVALNLSIDKKFQAFITRNSVACAMRDKNLVSDRVVNIETSVPGAETLRNGDTLGVTDSRDVETVLTGITKLMGKMDRLITSFDDIAAKSKDPQTSVGALLGSRELYDRLLSGVNQTDTALGEGRQVLAGFKVLGDTIHASLGTLLTRADTASARLTRASGEVEKFSIHANGLADRGETALRHMDLLMLQSSDKVEQAGGLMDAVSKFWFIRGKLEPREVKAGPREMVEARPEP